MVEVRSSENRHEQVSQDGHAGLREFFFLRHGARLDQLDPSWRTRSPTPYDTPISRHGAEQAKLTGQCIASHASLAPTLTGTSLAGIDSNLSGNSSSSGNSNNNSGNSNNNSSDGRRRRRPPRYVIHSSPFLRCVQTSLALASMLSTESAVSTMSSHRPQHQSRQHSHDEPESGMLKPLLRLDCWLGEWMTPDYYTDIAPPPAMPELASHAAFWLRQLHKSPPSSPDASLLQHFKSLSLNADARDSSTFDSSAGQEADVSADAVQVDWAWPSTAFGEGGEYGEEWPEMHARFRSSLRQLLHHYAAQEAEEVIVILVTHGAGCNALMGAVSGRPVLTDVGIASLSHAILRPTAKHDGAYSTAQAIKTAPGEIEPGETAPGEIEPGDDEKEKEQKEQKEKKKVQKKEQERKISAKYCLLMSASTQHLTHQVHAASRGNTIYQHNQGGQSTIGRSGSWHNNLSRTNRDRVGLWTPSRRETRHVSAASTSSLAVPVMSKLSDATSALPLTTPGDGGDSLDPREMTRRRGRQRSFTVQTCGVYNP